MKSERQKESKSSRHGNGAWKRDVWMHEPDKLLIKKTQLKQMQSVVLAVKNAKSAKIRKNSSIIGVVFDLKAVHPMGEACLGLSQNDN